MVAQSEGGSTAAPSRRPTLKTIADLCGLCVPTVSRALNDSSAVGDETKRRVRQIAEEIGYVPDRAAVRLRTGRTNTISLAFVIHRDDQMGQLITSVANALQSTNFQVGIAPVLSNERSLDSIQHVVTNRLADAVIFNETLTHDPRVEYLLDRGFPFATHGRDELAHLHPHFDFDNLAFARKSAELLHKRGRRHLALFGPPLHHNYGHETFVGASETALALGLDFTPIDGAFSNEQLARLHPVARRFVAQHPSCDGFVCSSGAATLAVASALEEAGKVIGRDVDLIAKGSPLSLGMIRPGILAIEEDVGQAADFLTRAVLRALQAPDLPPLQHVQQPDFSAYL